MGPSYKITAPTPTDPLPPGEALPPKAVGLNLPNTVAFTTAPPAMMTSSHKSIFVAISYYNAATVMNHNVNSRAFQWSWATP